MRDDPLAPGLDAGAPPTPAGRELDATAATTTHIADAISSGLGALLADKDVSEIASLEGSFVEVRRRGRRERLDVMIEGPLFALLRDAGAERGVVRMRTAGTQSGGVHTGAHDVVAGPLADGRIALRIVKTGAPEATFESLVEEGVLPPGVDLELRAAVLEGAGVIVAGPARAARKRVVGAIVRALAERLSFFGATDSLASLVAVPLEKGAPVVDKAKAAAALGCDVIAALDISPHTAVTLARAELGVPFVVSIAAPSWDGIEAAFDDARMHVSAFAGTTAIIGHGPDGAARLAELRGPMRAEGMNDAPSSAPNPTARGSAANTSATLASRGLPSSTPSPAASPSPSSSMRDVAAPAEVSGLRARPSFASASSASSLSSMRDARSQEGAPLDDALPPLAALPAAWASDAPDDDPGWELGEPPPAGGDDPPSTSPSMPTSATNASGAPKGSFDAALAAAGKGKPSFAPRAPKPHPQTAQLRGAPMGGAGGDPFGGLTLEPPPGGPRVDPGDDSGDDEDNR